MQRLKESPWGSVNQDLLTVVFVSLNQFHALTDGVAEGIVLDPELDVWPAGKTALCGKEMHRDVNAALNILARGLDGAFGDSAASRQAV